MQKRLRRTIEKLRAQASEKKIVNDISFCSCRAAKIFR